MRESDKPNVLPRRRVLQAASLAAAAPLARPFIANAKAAETIKIGLLLAKTGDIAAQTEYLANGTFLALEQRGNKIMGQPAELIWLDEPTPQGAQQNMQKPGAGEQSRRDARRLAQLQRARRASHRRAAENSVRINNAAATDINGKNCNRYTFRLNTPVAAQAAMFAPYLMGNGKKWYFITANYAFGQDIAKSFKELLKRGRRHHRRR